MSFPLASGQLRSKLLDPLQFLHGAVALHMWDPKHMSSTPGLAEQGLCRDAQGLSQQPTINGP